MVLVTTLHRAAAGPTIDLSDRLWWLSPAKGGGALSPSARRDLWYIIPAFFSFVVCLITMMGEANRQGHESLKQPQCPLPTSGRWWPKSATAVLDVLEL